VRGARIALVSEADDELNSRFFPKVWPDLAERYGTPNWSWIKHLDEDREAGYPFPLGEQRMGALVRDSVLSTPEEKHKICAATLWISSTWKSEGPPSAHDGGILTRSTPTGDLVDERSGHRAGRAVPGRNLCGFLPP
jgi:hypothetical protein